MISEISNSKSEFNQFRTFLTLYDNFIFESIKFVFMFKNLSSAKKIDFESMNLWSEWMKKKIDCAFLNRSQNSKRKRNCFCVNFQLCRKIRKMNFVCQKKMIQLSFDFDCKFAKRYSFILHTSEKIRKFDQWISMNRMISCLTKMIAEKKKF